MPSNTPNRDTARSWAYHNATKHSEWSIRASPHYLDFANQPLALKIYTTLDPIPLPRDAEQTGISALSAISSAGIPATGETIPSLQDLARILYFSAGITKKKTYPGGEMYFRAASCTGALYEFELYIVCGDLPDLKAGVYHFGPGDYALRLLREGDYRGVLRQQAPAVIVCAGTYWRNAWKYRDRTYRHFGWDNGTMLANMLAMTAALRLPSKVVSQFVDSDVNALLDLDTQREVAFSMVTIGHTEHFIPPAKETPHLGFPTAPLSEHEIDYPAMRAMHEASSLGPLFRDGGEIEPQISPPSRNSGPPPAAASDPIEQVILRRGSSRQFERLPITQDELKTILDSASCGIPADFPPMNDIYLIVNAVDGLNPGAYFYERETGKLEGLKEGDFRSQARYLGLGQDLPGDAAADVFFLADLNSILERYGNRGYRAVQLEAGILGGKMYLAAYAQRLGATGLTFFDDDVIDFFGPHAKGKSAIFLVALGKGRKVR